MEVHISSRHMSITPRLEHAVRTKIGQLDRFLGELDTAEVHFDESRNPRIADRETCEVTLSGHGHYIRCKVSAPNAITAVDLAEAKLERQIRKLRTKLQLRHHGRGDTIRNLSEALTSTSDGEGEALTSTSDGEGEALTSTSDGEGEALTSTSDGEMVQPASENSAAPTGEPE